MLDGLFMLLTLSVVMALASFLAGALPLSMSLSSSQLRLLSTIGMGVLVGTSLVVIIPEGIEAVYTAGSAGGHLHSRRSGQLLRNGVNTQWTPNGMNAVITRLGQPLDVKRDIAQSGPVNNDQMARDNEIELTTSTSPTPATETSHPGKTTEEAPQQPHDPEEHEEAEDSKTFYIGLSLISGFILMFLIDKLPRHASEKLQPPPATRHISLNNLSQLNNENISSGDDESESFLQSLTPTPKQSRSLATTTGLVIHAAADGIAMGASASTANTSLGFIIFIAIMVHKAPAAFGLTSVLLKQGLSKRAARGHLIIFSLAAPVGALSTWFLVNLLGGSHVDGAKGQWWTGMLLLFSGGTFLYVAMHAMQEDPGHESYHSGSNGYIDGGSQRKQPKPQIRDTMAAVGGMLIPLLTQFWHDS
ncbi:zip metal ion [Phlyctema vagabunda]|uniref:Zip metal ion n=1 Tax=Phlyctema vagabunda TaxID=108571 RepID=A0ABR4P7L7_9HELO